MKKIIAFILLLLSITIITMCRSPERASNVRKGSEYSIDSIFDGKGNLVGVRKRKEINEHRNTYYYTVFALVLITGLILFSKTKQ